MLYKNNDIESLRAIAIFFVAFLHLDILLLVPLTPFTWIKNHYDLSVGVDLFFVISGYVITHSLYRLEQQSGPERWRLVAAFWIKRFFRLTPTAFMWLTLAAVFMLLRHDDWGQRNDVIPFIAAALNLINLYSAYCVSSITADMCQTSFIHGHYWSLSLEEQFYFVIPLLFFFMNRRMFILSLLTLVAVLLTLKRPYWSYGWFFRIDGFCWGILLAMLHSRLTHPGIIQVFSEPLVRRVCLLILCALLPYVSHSVQGWGGEAKTYGVGLVAFVCAVIVWVAAMAPPDTEPPGRIRGIFVSIGARSYSLYVSHLIVYMIIRDLWNSSSLSSDYSSIAGPAFWTLALMMVAVAVTLLATELNYRVIEIGPRSQGKRLANRLLSRSTQTPKDLTAETQPT